MDSSHIQGTRFDDPTSNHKCLCLALLCLARKYNESRQSHRRNKSRLPAPKEFVNDTAINPDTAINSSLFCNSILYYVFSQAGLDSKMQDKNGRPYPSNALNSIYTSAWTTEISSTRIQTFKNIFCELEQLLEHQPDHEFYHFIDNTIIPYYLGVCASTDAPSYKTINGAKVYKQSIKNALMAWLADYVTALLLPAQVGKPAYEIWKELDSFVTSLRVAAGAQEPVADPEVTQRVSNTVPVEEITETIELPVFDVPEKEETKPVPTAAPVPRQVEICPLSALLNTAELSDDQQESLVNLLIAHQENLIVTNAAINELQIRKEVLESEYKVLSLLLQKHKKPSAPDTKEQS